MEVPRSRAWGCNPSAYPNSAKSHGPFWRRVPPWRTATAARANLAERRAPSRGLSCLVGRRLAQPAQPSRQLRQPGLVDLVASKADLQIQLGQLPERLGALDAGRAHAGTELPWRLRRPAPQLVLGQLLERPPGKPAHGVGQRDRASRSVRLRRAAPPPRP